MTEKELVLGMKVYQATMEVPPDDNGRDVLCIREFTVTRAGEARFEIRSSGRGSFFGTKRGGYYKTNSSLLASLQRSPMQAVDYLELKMRVELKEMKECTVRLEKRTEEAAEAIRAWKENRDVG